MATAKKTTKKPAAKKVARRNPAAPAKKTVRRAMPKAKPVAAKALQANITDAANVLLKTGRKDIEALMKVNKRSYSQLQTLVKKRTSLLKDAVHDWQAAAKNINVSKPMDSVHKLDELGKEAFSMALDNIRDLADLAAKSQADAFKIVKKNIEGNISEVKKLLKK